MQNGTIERGLSYFAGPTVIYNIGFQIKCLGDGYVRFRLAFQVQIGSNPFDVCAFSAISYYSAIARLGVGTGTGTEGESNNCDPFDVTWPTLVYEETIPSGCPEEMPNPDNCPGCVIQCVLGGVRVYEP